MTYLSRYDWKLCVCVKGFFMFTSINLLYIFILYRFYLVPSWDQWKLFQVFWSYKSSCIKMPLLDIIFINLSNYLFGIHFLMHICYILYYTILFKHFPYIPTICPQIVFSSAHFHTLRKTLNIVNLKNNFQIGRVKWHLIIIFCIRLLPNLNIFAYFVGHINNSYLTYVKKIFSQSLFFQLVHISSE